MQDQQKRPTRRHQESETAYLLRSPANARTLANAIAQMKQAQKGPVSDADLATMKDAGRD